MLAERTADVIVPVFRNSSTLTGLVDDLSFLHKKLADQADISLRAIFIVDGCPDFSEEVLLREKHRPVVSQIHVLERNVGALQAVRFGMLLSDADVSVVCSADRQEPLALIESLIHEALASEWISCGVREDRADANLASTMFWKLSRKYINPKIPEQGIDIFAMAQNARDLVLKNTLRDHPITFQLYQFRRPPVPVPYDRKIVDTNRRSGWTFRSKLSYAIDVLFSFSEFPMKLAYRLLLLNFILFFGLVLSSALERMSVNSSILESDYSRIVSSLMLLSTTLIMMVALAYVRQIFLERNSESSFLSRCVYSQHPES